MFLSLTFIYKYIVWFKNLFVIHTIMETQNLVSLDVLKTKMDPDHVCVIDDIFALVQDAELGIVPEVTEMIR